MPIRLELQNFSQAVTSSTITLAHGSFIQFGTFWNDSSTNRGVNFQATLWANFGTAGTAGVNYPAAGAFVAQFYVISEPTVSSGMTPTWTALHTYYRGPFKRMSNSFSFQHHSLIVKNFRLPLGYSHFYLQNISGFAWDNSATSSLYINWNYYHWNETD